MEREDFLEVLQADVRRWQTREDLWRAAAARTAAPVQGRYLRQLELLTGIRRCAEQTLHDVRRSPRDAWHGLAPSALSARRELRISFERLRRRIEDIENLWVTARHGASQRGVAGRLPLRPPRPARPL